MGRVEKARESLKAAQLLYNAECYNSCASRCYYAMFQMAIAALIDVGIAPPHGERYSHAWVHSALARELVHRRKVLPRSMVRFLPDAMALRREADYSDTPLKRKFVARLLQRCYEFMNTLEQKVFHHVK